ncbi:mitochondrial-processing protease subunit alpha [Sporobolomyces salmoneus]|uniref:mitochondrial-processing protease subunit alpha n=1 Tax=Sporobolomyces salmoneus TaxID=183962 RepID=UPI00317272F2
MLRSLVPRRSLLLPTTSRSLSLSSRSLATGSTTSSSSPTPLNYPELKVTTLPNGIRVASDPTPGHFVAAGVYVDAGSRYESSRTTGSGHMVDRLGFKSTRNRTADEMTQEIEQLGGQFLSSSSRETIMYQASTYTHSLPKVLSILSDTVLNPLITSEELEIQREAALWEVGEIKQKPEMILPELLHETAYKGNTLGNPLLCPEERLETMTTETIREYLEMWYRPERLVVAAAGVEHEQLVELAEKYFGAAKSSTTTTTTPNSQRPTTIASSSSSSNLSNSSAPFSTTASTSASLASSSQDLSSLDPTSFEYLSTAPARYTGGQLMLENPDLELTHVYVGFEGLSIHDEDIYALATLQVLLGGGGSFSAGGPGKGMYSRLYTSVLNQHYSVDFCSAFHHVYLDSGLFGLQISVHPSFVSQVPQLLAQQFDSITRPMRAGIDEGDLRRARNQLKSSLAMALESRMVQVEDLGRQVQVHGRKVSMPEMSSLIDRVTLSDLYRVANRVLRPQSSPVLSDRKKNGKVTVVAQGKIAGGRLGDDVEEALRRRGIGAQ